MKFRDDYGVYVCSHIFENSRPILDSMRDTDGSWQFLCGADDCINEGEPHLVGVGHLVKRDPSVNELTSLDPGMYAERASESESWKFGKLTDEAST